MTIVPLLALLGASCWLIFRSLSLPGRLLASFLIPLSLSEPTFIDFGVFSELRNLYFGSKLASQGFQTSNVGTAECAERSAAPPQVAPRAKSKIKVLAKYLQAQDAQLQKPRPRSPDYPLSISPPGSAHSAGPASRSPPYRLAGVFFRFFSLPKRLLKFASKNHRKKCENLGFWSPKTLPKPSQNPSKIDVPKNMRFFIDFCSACSVFSIFDFLEMCVLPQ